MQTQPNFLFVFPDQHRGDWMPYSAATRKRHGTEGLELAAEMPNLHGLMARGVSFTHAVTPAPVCAPARACLAAGQRYANCRVANNGVNYDAALPSFYAVLREAGYSVGGVGKFDLNKADLEWGDGFHELLARVGFTHALDNEGKMDAVQAYDRGSTGPYGRYLASRGLLEGHVEDMKRRMRVQTDETTFLPDDAYCDNYITRNGLDMLRAFPSGRPWFLQVNYAGPHDPWDVTAGMKAAFRHMRYPDAVGFTNPENNNGIRQNYAAMLANIDRGLGLLMEAVKARGDWENTIVIYSSDHGEMLGDGNLYGKSKPNQASIHVPMVIDASRHGGIQGAEIASPVEMQDLAETVLAYAGRTLGNGQGSVSLQPILSGQADAVRSYCISELISPARGLPVPFGTISDGRYKLICVVGQEDQLYDLYADPHERTNILPTKPAVAEALTMCFANRKHRTEHALARYEA